MISGDLTRLQGHNTNLRSNRTSVFGENDIIIGDETTSRRIYLNAVQEKDGLEKEEMMQ